MLKRVRLGWMRFLPVTGGGKYSQSLNCVSMNKITINVLFYMKLYFIMSIRCTFLVPIQDSVYF